MRRRPKLFKITLIAIATSLSQTFVLSAGFAQEIARPPATGAFRDNKGENHSWQITASHSLMWDGAPYLPVGGSFTPACLNDELETSWQKDVSNLELLKSKGVLDVLIAPQKSLPEIKQTLFQRLLDYLDANGFKYGIAFGTGLNKPLAGHVIRPTVYRYQEKGGLTATWQVSNTNAGLYVVSDPDGNDAVVKSNYIEVANDLAIVSLEIATEPDKVKPGDRLNATFYPHRFLNDENTIPDLWGGYDEYRDQLLRFFSKVKPGKGFRFFLDPLARRLGFGGDANYLIPDSPGFKLEWEAFLSQTYGGSPERLRDMWGLDKDQYKSIAEYANIVPLWEKLHGLPFYYNPVTKENFFAPRNRTQWWSDFLAFRESSIKYYMNSTADMLKSQVANVPVLYTWTQTSGIFLNQDSSGGFDGLCIPAKGGGESLTSRTLVPGYSEIAQAGRSLWCVATEVASLAKTAAVSATKLPGVPTLIKSDNALVAPPGGYASSPDLNQSLDRLMQIGLKGVFVSGLGGNAKDSGVQSWVENSASLDWLGAYGQKKSADANAAKYKPRLLYYPAEAPGPARPGFIPGSSTLWLNGYYPGIVIDMWPTVMGYKMLVNDRWITVLTSLKGKREFHLRAVNAKSLRATTADGLPVSVKVLNPANATITLDSAPTILDFAGQDVTVTLQEPTSDIIEQLERLAVVAERQKLPTLQTVKGMLAGIARQYAKKDFDNAYTLGRSELERLTDALQPYIWIEGESPPRERSFFDERVENPEASGYGYLNLSNSIDLPDKYRKTGYGVSYVFDILKEGVYNIWIAGSLPSPATSELFWRLDSIEDHTVAEPSAHGPKWFGDRFGWMLLGSVRMSKDRAHTLSLFIPNRAASPGLYSFAVDALMITPGVFRPNGTLKPVPFDSPVSKLK